METRRIPAVDCSITYDREDGPIAPSIRHLIVGAMCGTGKEKQCLMSMLPEQNFTLKKTVMVTRSFSYMNSETTCDNGSLRSGISHVHTAVSRTMLAAIHQAMFPTMPLCMAGSFR